MRRGTFGAVAAVAWCVGVALAPAEDEAERARLDAEIKLTAGVAYQNNGMDQEALQRFEDALALDPDNGTAHFLAATALNGMKRYSDALPHLQRARELNPHLPAGRIDWYTGEAQYWTGAYDGALSSFQAAVSADPRDAFGHFYLGLTHLQLGQGQSGMASLDRAVALDASLSASGAYYTGRQLYEQGDAEAARAEFEKALSGAGETNLQTASSSYLAALQPKAAPEQKKFHFRVGYFVDGDSNVQAQPDNEVIGASGESDGRQVLQLRVAGYPLLSNSSNSTVGIFFNSYQSFHFDLGEFDLTAPQAVFSYTWGKDPRGYMNGPISLTQAPIGRTPVVFSVQAGYSYYMLDGESYVGTAELGTSLRIPEGRKTATQIDLDYRDHDYGYEQALDTNADGIDDLNATLDSRSGSYFQARVIQTVQLGKPAYSVDIGLRFGQNDADGVEGSANDIAGAIGVAGLTTLINENGGISDDFDFDETELFTNWSFSLPRRIGLAAQLAWVQRSFDNVNSQALAPPAPPPPGSPEPPDYVGPNADELREDDLLVLSTSVVFGFGQHWSVQAGLAWYDQSSNKDFYTWDRGVVSVGFNWVY